MDSAPPTEGPQRKPANTDIYVPDTFKHLQCYPYPKNAYAYPLLGLRGVGLWGVSTTAATLKLTKTSGHLSTVCLNLFSCLLYDVQYVLFNSITSIHSLILPPES